MPAPIYSDEEFIALWARHGSAAAIAQVTGMPIRGIFKRRASLESKQGTVLPNQDDRSGAELVMSSRRDVNRLGIVDGTVLIGSDAHYSPGHIPVAHKALCNLLAEMGTEVKAVILNGDILDGGTISRHPRQRFGARPSVKQELEAVQERLGEIEKVRPAGCQLLRTYGNHCARFEARLANQVPEYEGIGGFLLRDHLPHWADSLRIDINDDCVVIHDWHSGVHSGWNDVIKGGCHTVTGHTHELSVKAHRGFKDTHYGIKTGMLADEYQSEFDYRQGKPGFNWQSGFAVLTWREGQLLYPELCAVRDDERAYFRGKLLAD